MRAGCNKRQALLLAWQAAAQAYSSAVNALVNEGHKASTDEYYLLKREAERTRTATADRRNAFELHTEEHGC